MAAAYGERSPLLIMCSHTKYEVEWRFIVKRY